MGTGEYEKGEAAFAEANRLAPDLVMTKINYGRALLRNGKPEQARTHYSAAFEQQPDFPILAVEYASLHEQTGEYAEAERLYLYAWELGRTRDMLLACQFLSRIEYRKGNMEEAKAWLRKGLELAPGDMRLTNLLETLERGRDGE